MTAAVILSYDRAMSHLINPVNPVNYPSGLCLKRYLQDLKDAHDAVANRVYKFTKTVTNPALAKSTHWAIELKREQVDMNGAHAMVGVTEQPLGELLNQLSTVERLLDTLEWAKGKKMTTVVEANPTTSRGPEDTCSHDLVVTDGTQIMVFEVSDVANSNNGNANGKMTKDLKTLGKCNCKSTQKLLAVSPSSGEYLKRKGLTVLKCGSGSETWIVKLT